MLRYLGGVKYYFLNFLLLILPIEIFHSVGKIDIFTVMWILSFWGL